MYNLENIQNAVKAYSEEVKSLDAIKNEFSNEVTRFCAVVRDFMGTARIDELTIGPAKISDGKFTWENDRINREVLDKAYDAFDNYVTRSIEHVALLKKQYKVD